jgi:hypothetical protein
LRLEKYIKLTAAAKFCGLDKRTLLARLVAKGFMVPADNHRRPLLVRERDVEQVMRDYAIQPRKAIQQDPTRVSKLKGGN